jgi:5-methylcytosine-specific restriction endonuclease McrA
LSRRYPAILPLLDSGALSLTTVGLLAPHLTDENSEALIEAAHHKTRREVETMLAAVTPQPDIPSGIRMLPVRRSSAPLPVPVPVAALHVVGAPSGSLLESCDRTSASVDDGAVATPASTAAAALSQVRVRSTVASLSPRRYLIRMTVGEETQQKLVRARDLLRHMIPDGDPAAIFDRALTLLLARLQRTKSAATDNPRTPRSGGLATGRSRHVPAPVRRAVWARDEGRCAFVGTGGRCDETGALEFHHVVPFACGGATSVENIELRCRAHNAYEGARAFGDWRGKRRGKQVAGTAACSERAV